MSKPGDEPAYPYSALVPGGMPTIYDDAKGLTKRELLAALAMQGMLRGEYDAAYGVIAVRACEAADALLAELAKETTK
jgi:hypothetical protein